MRLEEADVEDDLDRIEGLLQSNGLPHDDLTTSPVRLFVGYEDGRLVGVGGLETYGDVALLRSVVVPHELRASGYGAALYREIESRAREEGIEQLYLLTTTAASFFAGRGFETVERGTAPEPIRDTAEFRELCSSEATCMRKVIG